MKASPFSPNQFIKKFVLTRALPIGLVVTLFALGGNLSLNAYKLKVEEGIALKKEQDDLRAQIEILKGDEILKNENNGSLSREFIQKRLKKLQELENKARKTKKKHDKIADLALQQELNFQKYREYFETALISSLSYKDQIAEAKKKIEEKEKEKKAVEELLDQAKREIEKLKKEGVNQKYSFLSLEKKHDLLNEKNSGMMKEYSDLKKEVVGLRKKAIGLERDNTKKEKQIVLLDSKVKITQSSKFKLESKLKDLIVENNELVDKVKRISNMNASNEQLQIRYEKLKSEFNKVSSQNVIFEEELDSLREKTKQLDYQNKALTSSNEKFERVQKQGQSLKESYENLERNYLRTLEKISKLEEKNKTIAQIETKYRQLLAEKNIYEDKYQKTIKQKRKINRKIASLNNQRKRADELESELNDVKKQRDGLFQEVTEMGLGSATRYAIAQRLKKEFQKHGIKATVDMKTSEVKIDFNKFYFSYGSARLSPFMKEKLKEIFPIYANSLFSMKESSKIIKNVEIVGASSPTFNKKIVNPKKVDSEFYKKAMEYNLDLSYRRAKSIFKYIFHNNKIQFPFKEELLNKTKLTTLGYLNSKKPQGRSVSSLGTCKDLSCSEYQVVYIRINLKD